MVADAEQFRPAGSVGALMMFDSFHHLTDPRSFVRRASAFASRFLLIEPRGDSVVTRARPPYGLFLLVMV